MRCATGQAAVHASGGVRANSLHCVSLQTARGPVPPEAVLLGTARGDGAPNIALGHRYARPPGVGTRAAQAMGAPGAGGPPLALRLTERLGGVIGPVQLLMPFEKVESATCRISSGGCIKSVDNSLAPAVIVKDVSAWRIPRVGCGFVEVPFNGLACRLQLV